MTNKNTNEDINMLDKHEIHNIGNIVSSYSILFL